MMEHFIGKKEKWTNKGTDKKYVADFLSQCISGQSQNWKRQLTVHPKIISVA